MNKFLVFLLAFSAFIQLNSCAPPEQDNEIVKTVESFNLALIDKSDEDRLGVEMEMEGKEHFHNTKLGSDNTDDGVRLGCYSHDLNGKSYMNYYVADAESYRLVPHEKIITVFPTKDEPKNASFIKSFTEEEIVEKEISYLFPEGCELPEECPDKCCEKVRAQIFFPKPDPNSCCKATSKLLLPIDLSELNKVPVASIDVISKESDPAKMLLKLLSLIEKTRKK